MKKATPRDKMLHFRLPDDLYDELKRRIEESGLSLTDYMKKVLFAKHDHEEIHHKEATDEYLMATLTDIRNSLCGAEDIYRQINQDTLRILRYVHTHFNMTEYLTKNILPNKTSKEIAGVISKLVGDAKENFPERPDMYHAAKELKRKEEAQLLLKAHEQAKIEKEQEEERIAKENEKEEERVKEEREREEQRAKEEERKMKLAKQRDELFNKIRKENEDG